MADERQPVIITTAAEDEILEKARMDIRISSLGQDTSHFFHQCRWQLAEVGYTYQADDS